MPVQFSVVLGILPQKVIRFKTLVISFRWYNFSKKLFSNYGIIKVTLKSHTQNSSLMPFCYSGVFGVWVGRCMQRLTLFLKKIWKFSNLILSQKKKKILSQFLQYVPKSPSLALDIIIGHQDGHFKRSFHPSSFHCPGLKNVPPYMIWWLLFTAEIHSQPELKASIVHLGVPESNLVQVGLTGLDCPSQCPTSLLQLFYHRSYFLWKHWGLRT